MNNLTIEQAISNVELVVGTYKGTKAEHIALEQSIQMIRREIENCDKWRELAHEWMSKPDPVEDKVKEAIESTPATCNK